jgi:hypothetical protein
MWQRRAGMALVGMWTCIVAMPAAMAQMVGVEVVPNNGVTGILFGTSVGISGNIAAVGAAADDGGRGSVSVYTRGDGSWPYQATLTAAEGLVGDQLGYFTEAHGNQVLASSPAHGTDMGPFPGAVFVFTQSGSDWSETQVIEPTPPVDGGFFGARFALDGTTLLASGTNGDGQAIVYAFADQGGQWTQTGTFQPTEGGDFGSHISISGNVAVVGAAFGMNGSGVQTGVAYVFTRSGNAWTETTRLESSTSSPGDQFGTSVSVSGGTIVVGAPNEGVDGTQQGAAHVFENSGGNWSEVTRLSADDGESGNTLGKDVRVCGQRIFVGSSNFSEGSNSAEGVVYQWDEINGAWTSEGEFTLPPPGRSNAYFGDHLGVSSSGLIVGAPFADEAYVYDTGCIVDPIYQNGFD